MFQMRLEPDELKRLQDEAEKSGFKTTADFVRYMTIGEGRSIQSDLKKILQKLEEK